MDLLLFPDRQIFLYINHLPHTDVLNLIALSISGAGTGGLIWFAIAGVFFLKEERANHWFFPPFLLAGGMSWVLVERILKPIVGRLRPDELTDAIIVGNPSYDFSWPSGHATIAFAMAAILSRHRSAWKGFYYALALLIAFTRVYLGKHYPSDVIAGAFLGWIIGVSAYLVCYHVVKHGIKKRKP